MGAVLPPRRGDRNTGSDSVLARRSNGQDGDDERFLTVNGGNSAGRAREEGGDRGSHSNTLSRSNGAPTHISRIRQWLLSLVSLAIKKSSAPPTPHNNESKHSRTLLPCSMCHAAPPTVPYIASCGHCYCYLCLRTAVTDNLRFSCVECEKLIVSSRRGSS